MHGMRWNLVKRYAKILVIEWKRRMIMGIYLNPGNDLFSESIASEIYVDKTNLISYEYNLDGVYFH